MKRSDLNFIVDALALVGVAALTSTGIIMRFVLPPFRGGRGKYASPMTLWDMDRHQWGEIHFLISIGLMAVLVFHLFLHWRWIVSVVCNKTREGSGIRAVLGLISLFALLTATASPFFSTVEEVPRKHMEKGKRHQPNPAQKSAPPVQQDIPKAQELGSPSEENDEPIVKDKTPPTSPGIQPKLETPDPSKEEHTTSHGHSSMEIDIRGRMTLQEVEDASGVSVNVLLEKLGLPPETGPDERLGQLRRKFGFTMSQARKAVEESLEEPSTVLPAKK